MAQLNLRLEDALVRKFETTAAARGLTNREAAAEALAAWTEKYVGAIHAVVGAPTSPAEPQR